MTKQEQLNYAQSIMNYENELIFEELNLKVPEHWGKQQIHHYCAKFFQKYFGDEGMSQQELEEFDKDVADNDML
mgnify:CR=1 FL=1|jgi:hypothetical protein